MYRISVWKETDQNKEKLFPRTVHDSISDDSGEKKTYPDAC